MFVLMHLECVMNKRLTVRLVVMTVLSGLLAACGSAPPPVTVTPVKPTIAPREHRCQSLYLLSDLSRGQLLSGMEGRQPFEVPVGQWLDESLNEWFWLDSRSQTQALKWAIGFAPGTGIRNSGGELEVQLLLQIQYASARGHSHFAGVAGRARAKTAAEASAQALEQLLDALARELVEQGMCRSLATR